MKNQSGVFITALGLPCTGKSSVMKELGALCGLPVFLEPEEQYWLPAERNIKHIKYKQSVSSPEIEARKLQEMLVEAGIIA